MVFWPRSINQFWTGLRPMEHHLRSVHASEMQVTRRLVPLRARYYEARGLIVVTEVVVFINEGHSEAGIFLVNQNMWYGDDTLNLWVHFGFLW